MRRPTSLRACDPNSFAAPATSTEIPASCARSFPTWRSIPRATASARRPNQRTRRGTARPRNSSAAGRHGARPPDGSRLRNASRSPAAPWMWTANSSSSKPARVMASRSSNSSKPTASPIWGATRWTAWALPQTALPFSTDCSKTWARATSQPLRCSTSSNPSRRAPSATPRPSSIRSTISWMRSNSSHSKNTR